MNKKRGIFYWLSNGFKSIFSSPDSMVSVSSEREAGSDQSHTHLIGSEYTQQNDCSTGKSIENYYMDNADFSSNPSGVPQGCISITSPGCIQITANSLLLMIIIALIVFGILHLTGENDDSKTTAPTVSPEPETIIIYDTNTTGNNDIIVYLNELKDTLKEAISKTKNEAAEENEEPIILLNANGGFFSPSGASLVEFDGRNYPEPEYPYHKFLGWYVRKEDGARYEFSQRVSVLYACWEENDLSEWIPYEELPEDASIAEEKWAGESIELVTGYQKELEGYTLLDSVTDTSQAVVENTYYVANIPNGFPSKELDGIQFLSEEEKDQAIDEAISKDEFELEETKDEQKKYIYWHWTVPVTNEVPLQNIPISGEKGTKVLFNEESVCTDLFEYFLSDEDLIPQDKNMDPSVFEFVQPDKTSTLWYRTEYHVVHVAAYRKIYTHQKSCRVEFFSEPESSSNLVDVTYWVKYRKE
ncbi:MAG: hypothetical protein IJJ85_09010 [Clostridia bacterium]|nr:hypothetical protein [Clostridia bacterium]